MRAAESAYWDNEAKNKLGANFRDNIWKRQYLVPKILMEGDLIFQNILEIGVGAGITFGAIQVALLGQFNYVGTDVAPRYAKETSKQLGFTIVNTDICKLPECEGGYTRIVCLDSLEHVNPEDRDKGFDEMNRVMAEHCRILINLPVEETAHNLQFDHPFTLMDIENLRNRTSTELIKCEINTVPCKSGPVRYQWVVLER